ncbi:SEC-C metal-binding domain-containing protein [Neobacillus sp. OS1-32]|uniref:YecA family protein n=1 Tax=Neobacillus sp. OS1-32 TaxID=3070682 RepID=UPI0027E1FAEF|nr:SEC-C metal-binding domain-containing protein [Neobacillus sp. OS1-32]WML32481.1 SEC-C metal-binding domain-containing protein [Neobacillus sp. OS1-32]
MEKSDVLSGNTFSYIEVFEEKKGLVLGTEVNDIKYIIYDQYCMNPSCNCDNVILIFVESNNNDSEFAIRLSLKKKRYEILDIYGISRKQVDEIVKDSLKDSEEAIGLLRKRYKEMKEAGKAVLQGSPEINSNVIELPVEKPKRNEPCPCGSGKKYKKCCGM